MKKLLFYLTFLVIGCNSSTNKNIVIYTNLGEIQLELYHQKATTTCTNFLNYIEGRHFDGKSFYRTVTPLNQPYNDIKIEVIQGGISFNDNNSIFQPIKHESTKYTGIKHIDGTISMARGDTGTVTSEFFICIGDQPELDFGGGRNPDLQGFAAFGCVTKGMKVVKDIQKQPETEQFLIKPVIIDSIRIVN